VYTEDDAVVLSPEQLEIRSRGIGSSDAPAIVGLSPWQSPVDIYMRKRGLLAPQSGKQLTAGHRLEDAVVQWAARDHGWKVQRCGKTLVHKTEPWIIASPDRFLVENRRRIAIVEAKTTGTAHDWGHEMTDALPEYYRVQCQWQLTVVRSRQPHIELAYVPVLFFANREVKVYRVLHSPKLEAALVEACREFWFKHVVAGDPPELEPASDPAVGKFLAAVFNEVGERVVQAPVEAAAWAKRLHHAQLAAKAAEDAAEEARNYLKAYVGNDKGIRGPWGKFLWYLREGGPDYKAMCEDMFERFGVTDEGRAELAAAHRQRDTRVPRFTPDEEYFEEA
jgi:putative phage-type endonuclease